MLRTDTREDVMKKISVILLCLSLFLLGLRGANAYDLVLNNTPVQVYFSPNGGAAEAIIKEIGGARTEILVQAYSFTSTPIAKALVEAHKRGVKVQAILDKSQRSERYSFLPF